MFLSYHRGTQLVYYIFNLYVTLTEVFTDMESYFV